MLTPERGAISWNGAQIRSLGEEYSRLITYLGHRNAVKEELSSLENLRIASGLHGDEITPTQAQQALARVNADVQKAGAAMQAEDYTTAQSALNGMKERIEAVIASLDTIGGAQAQRRRQ